MRYSINRLEAFSDGVIAIIITLLVFNLPLPLPDEGDLIQNLLLRAEEFAAFFVSFFVIGVLWINHHDLFRLIHKADHILFLLNIFFLAGITIVPFTTRLMAIYIRTEQNQASALIYSGGYVFTSFFFLMMWRYASYKRRLIGDDVSDKEIETNNSNYNIGFALYLIVFILSFISAQIALLINLGLAIFSAIPTRESIATREEI